MNIEPRSLPIFYSGNFIVIAGTTLAVTGLTFAGVRFPWDSAQVLAPLIIGLVLVAAFILYEAKVPKEPSIPWEILTNRTTLSGYAATFVHGITSISILCEFLLGSSGQDGHLPVCLRLSPRLLPSVSRRIPHSIRCRHACHCFDHCAIRTSGRRHGPGAEEVPTSKLRWLGNHHGRVWLAEPLESQHDNWKMGRVSSGGCCWNRNDR